VLPPIITASSLGHIYFGAISLVFPCCRADSVRRNIALDSPSTDSTSCILDFVTHDYTVREIRGFVYLNCNSEKNIRLEKQPRGLHAGIGAIVPRN
jgi:hypothetical protein